MLRKIIKINEKKCNGCGLCSDACHEGAIGIVNGKAKLLRDDYCDGLGDCLPVCPTKAITFEEREADEYNEELVNRRMKLKKKVENLDCGCPGSHAKVIKHKENNITNVQNTELKQWPVKLKLVPINAAYFENANLLIAADCTAYAYGNFHSEFIKNRITVIGCPKLDDMDYTKKLTEIIKNNNIKSVMIARMEVPCCARIETVVKMALEDSGKKIPCQSITISTDGKILK